MAAEAVLFDLDGTIWDSWPWYAYLAGTKGRVSLADAASELAEGRPAATVLGQAGVRRARFPAMCEQHISRLPLYRGVRTGLQEISGRSMPTGVVTNLPGWMALPMLTSLGLRDYFKAIVDYNKPRRRKPNPEPLLIALRELGIAVSPAIWYVGDSANDCRAAHAAGLSFAWASYGYGQQQPPGADKIVNRFREVLRL